MSNNEFCDINTNSKNDHHSNNFESCNQIKISKF